MGKKVRKKKKKKRGKKLNSNLNLNRDGDKSYSPDVISVLSTVEKDRNDRLSNLPDSLLQYIISLLPLESAAQTRLLSTKWRDIWNTTCVQHGTKKDLVVAIVNLVDSIDWMKPLKHPWKLQFHIIPQGCVILVTVGINERLHLDFSHEQHYLVQQFFLDLDPISLNWRIQVRSLCLTSINHLSKDIVTSLLSYLPFVDTLEIRECQGLFFLKVSRRWRLRHLSIIDCELESLVILAELKSFCYRGRAPRISFNDDVNFNDIMLDFREGPECYTSECLELDSLNGAEYITLCQWTFEVMIRPNLHSRDPETRFNYLIELWWIDSSMEEEKINSLMSFLGACPKIEKLFVTIDPTCYWLRRKGNRLSNVFRGSKLRHLKMVKMDDFNNEEDETLFADHILSIACREPIILATSENSYTRRLVKVSPDRRKFVEELDVELLNAKHMHMSI